MSQVASLEKVLNLRENEKKQAQLDHSESVDFFEKVATQLYNLLKQKETLEQSLEQSLQKKMTITEIKHQSAYIETLKKQIIELQTDVNEARRIMNKKEQHLTKSHIEVKKIEKILENRRIEIKEKEKKEEIKKMDELSIRQYLAFKNR